MLPPVNFMNALTLQVLFQAWLPCAGGWAREDETWRREFFLRRLRSLVWDGR